MSIIPAAWLPDVPMRGLILHWTAGTYLANATDRRAYHLLVEGDTRLVRGVASIALNSGKLQPGYAAHTRACNTDFISLSQCCMGGAVESPYNPGKYPMKETQFEATLQASADLCRFYNIPPTPKTLMTHAEVQKNLGIWQRNKWDYTRLAFDPDIKGATAIGNMIRARVSGLLKGDGTVVETVEIPVIPAGGVAVVNVDMLNMRRGPGIEHDDVGNIPRGIQLITFETSGSWTKVKTPGGYVGWVNNSFLEMLDGPQAVEPTTPNPVRAKLNELRKLIDELEDSLDL